MKKKLILVIVLVIVLAAAIVFASIYIRNTRYISRDEALSVAMTRAVNDYGIEMIGAVDVDIDFEKDSYGNAWYEVEFKKDGREFEYIINALDGTVISAEAG